MKKDSDKERTQQSNHEKIDKKLFYLKFDEQTNNDASDWTAENRCWNWMLQQLRKTGKYNTNI